MLLLEREICPVLKSVNHAYIQFYISHVLYNGNSDWWAYMFPQNKRRPATLCAPRWAEGSFSFCHWHCIWLNGTLLLSVLALTLYLVVSGCLADLHSLVARHWRRQAEGCFIQAWQPRPQGSWWTEWEGWVHADPRLHLDTTHPCIECLPRSL